MPADSETTLQINTTRTTGFVIVEAMRSVPANQYLLTRRVHPSFLVCLALAALTTMRSGAQSNSNIQQSP